MQDVNKQIKNNLGLVYQLLNKFELAEDQDAESIAYEALHKSILTYKQTRGNAFSTYATCVISNALRGHLREKNKKRQLQCISMYTPISQEEDTGYLIDTIGTLDSTEDIICAKELKEAAYDAIGRLLEEMTSDNQKKIIIMWLESSGSATQKEIAKAVGVTQAAVSRYISSFKYNLLLELEDFL